jgi:hypothetical protein
VDWKAWHDAYDVPGSPLARRLQTVQQRIRVALDEGPSGPLKVISMCAGQGRDLLEVLATHPRRHEVRARLVELDPRNVAAAETAARASGLSQVEVMEGDAALTDHYQDMVPADVVLACGLFGNLSDRDIERTIGFCSQLCRTGGTVVWTRHHAPPDRFPLICSWFEDRGFERQWMSDPSDGIGVGVHRSTDTHQPLALGERMFTFLATTP